MNSKNEILNEIQSLSPLIAGMEKINPFTVPAGYFDSLRDGILENTIYRPSFIDVVKKQEQSVPDGYFDSLPLQILDRIKQSEKSETPAHEIRNLSPMLYAIQGENPYKVPTGYFGSLSEIILSRVIPAETARIVSFKKKSVWQYAAAALVTGLIALSSLWISNRKNAGQADTLMAYQPSSLSKTIIHTEAGLYKSELDITNQIASISKDEIISYLETTGTDADFELLANTVNETNLPDQNDYLLDEQALDNYLKNISSDNKNN